MKTTQFIKEMNKLNLDVEINKSSVKVKHLDLDVFIISTHFKDMVFTLTEGAKELKENDPSLFGSALEITNKYVATSIKSR